MMPSSPLSGAAVSDAPEVAAPGAGLYRRVWRWHFFAGLFCLPFIFLLASTGALYLFNQQIDEAVYADLLLRPAATAARQDTLPASRLVEQALHAEPGVARTLHWPVDAVHAVQVDVLREGAVRQVFLDPATGAVLGSMPEADRLMPLIKRIHSLTVAGNAGNALIEIVAGWVIVLVVTGAYLWWPRGRKAGVARIRPRASGRVWWRDPHAVTGAFTAVVILFLALTGMPWSLVWGAQVNGWLTANGLGTPAGVWGGVPRSTVPMASLGEVSWSLEQQMLPASSPPAAPAPDVHHGHDMPAHAEPPPQGSIGIDRATSIFAAAGLKDGYRLALPNGAEGVYSAVRLRSAQAGLRVIHLDQYSGKVLMDLGPRDVGAVARVTDWGISVHQGLEYGLPNQLLMLAGCIALMLLCVSSVVLWRKRRPAGRLAAPPRKEGDRLAAGVVAIAVGLGLVFPLLGASMLAAAVLEAAWSRARRRPVTPPTP